MRLLVLSSGTPPGAAITRRLRGAGFAVDDVPTLAAAREAILDLSYDCLVLDHHPPDRDAIAFLRELRATGDRSPAVLISAKTDAETRIRGLRMGADDFVSGEVRPDELALRVAKVATRGDPGVGGGAEIEIGAVRVNLVLRTVMRDRQQIHLTPSQFAVLALLARHRDRMVTTEELLERCWDGRRDPFSNPLNTQIWRLRKILDGAVRIESVRGAGYRIQQLGGEPHVWRERGGDRRWAPGPVRRSSSVSSPEGGGTPSDGRG